MLIIAVLAVACIALLALGFLAPRLSRRSEDRLDHGIDSADSRAREKGGLPGKLGDRSARLSRKAVDGSTDAGRSARRHVD